MRESDVALLHHYFKDGQVLRSCNYPRPKVTVLIMPVNDVNRCKIVWLRSSNYSFETCLSAIALFDSLFLLELSELPIEIYC